jgi:hypothetical protein
VWVERGANASAVIHLPPFADDDIGISWHVAFTVNERQTGDLVGIAVVDVCWFR